MGGKSLFIRVFRRFEKIKDSRNQDSTVRASLLSSNDNLFFFYQVKKKGKRKVIGVLDIYGFEIFKVLKVYAQDKICLCPLILSFQHFHPFSLGLKTLYFCFELSCHWLSHTLITYNCRDSEFNSSPPPNSTTLTQMDLFLVSLSSTFSTPCCLPASCWAFVTGTAVIWDDFIHFMHPNENYRGYHWLSVESITQ